MFYRILNFIFEMLVYSGYRRVYKLHKSFRFNGIFIRFYGCGEIKFGENCYVSYYSFLNVIDGTTFMAGNNVSIAHNVKIYTSTFDPEVLVRTGRKIIKRANVIIGDNVLIGSNVFICPGVTIGDNVIIGANSVVTKSIQNNTVAAGAPAKIIKFI